MQPSLLTWCHRLLHPWLPNCCLWCSLPVQQATAQLCGFCEADLPTIKYLGEPTNALVLPAIARGLQQHRFQQLLCVSWYQQPWQHWISQWKFEQDLACGDLLLQQFASHCQTWRKSLQVEGVCYVPMHAKRARQRGFNQAKQLATVAALALDLPLLDLFAVKHDYPHQVGQSRQQRRANLRKQFRLTQTSALPKRLLLVDDVVTTGATTNALCRLLQKQQVSFIAVACIAVTQAPRVAKGLYLDALTANADALSTPPAPNE